MKVRKVNLYILSLFILLILVFMISLHDNRGNIRENYNYNDSSRDVVNLTSEIAEKKQEMRAIWIPFMTLDMKSNFSEESFKNKFLHIIEQARGYKINTIVVHVRSHGDAMYKSNIFPWSHLITGNQGQSPGFDPLQFMVDETHKSGMEFHAWVNPLRIRVNGVPSKLSDSNPYVLWRDNPKSSHYTFSVGQDIYYNPAYSEVRDLIVAGVREIAENYNVDAIHFDDYFYPVNHPDIDSYEYSQYTDSVDDKNSALNQEKWRAQNINTLISQVYSTIKSINGNIRFGISPSGNIKNDYLMGADVYKWGECEGYVDYLCPQIYTNSSNPILPFEKAATEWRNLVKNKSIKLYYGLGVYKAGSDADKGTWKESNNIIMNQINYCRNIGCDGFMLYSWDYMNNPNTSKEVENVLKLFN